MSEARSKLPMQAILDDAFERGAAVAFGLVGMGEALRERYRNWCQRHDCEFVWIGGGMTTCMHCFEEGEAEWKLRSSERHTVAGDDK